MIKFQHFNKYTVVTLVFVLSVYVFVYYLQRIILSSIKFTEYNPIYYVEVPNHTKVQLGLFKQEPL